MRSGFNVTACPLFIIVGAAVLDHPWVAGLVGFAALSVVTVAVARQR